MILTNDGHWKEMRFENFWVMERVRELCGLEQTETKDPKKKRDCTIATAYYGEATAKTYEHNE